MTAPAPGSRFDPSLLYGRSDFGEFEARTRRMLGLEGLIPLDLGREIVPVMMLGDATVPGMGASRLRRFAGLPGQGGIGTGFWYKTEVESGVIIDEVRIVLSAATTVVMRYLGPNDADPAGLAAGGNMLDRARSGDEVSPLLRTAAAAASAFAPALNLIYASLVNLPAGEHILRIPFFLMTGAKFSVGAGQGSGINVFGRTF